MSVGPRIVPNETPAGKDYHQAYHFLLSNGREGYYEVTSISPDGLDGTARITPFGGAPSPKVLSWRRNDKGGAYVDGARVQPNPGDTAWGTAFNMAWPSEAGR